MNVSLLSQTHTEPVIYIILCLLAPPREVWLEPTSYSVDEDAGTAALTIRTNIPGPDLNGAVVFYTEDGTASGELVKREQYKYTYEISIAEL